MQHLATCVDTGARVARGLVAGLPCWGLAVSQSSFQLAGQFLQLLQRPDVIMYCLGALQRFDAMTAKEIEKLGYEIAVLGMNGLDINDPAKKYKLKSLQGEFSGLHLLSLMYTAFQQFKPGQDVGIDFSNEYQLAQGMHKK